MPRGVPAEVSKSKKRKRRSFTPEFKAEVVRLVKQGDKSVGQIARDRSQCDDRLRVVAFATQNANRQGDYFAGLARTVEASCQAPDDLSRPLGDARAAIDAAAAVDMVFADRHLGADPFARQPRQVDMQRAAHAHRQRLLDGCMRQRGARFRNLSGSTCSSLKAVAHWLVWTLADRPCRCKAMTYSVKEVFYTLQGEGLQAGKPAVFCRFAGCNLWTGREEDRSTAVCRFCDTDFVGTDGTFGGKYAAATD